jgi:hypothetical protein
VYELPAVRAEAGIVTPCAVELTHVWVAVQAVPVQYHVPDPNVGTLPVSFSE